MSTGLIINADDYAQDAAIDAGIIQLAQAGGVTATSVMVWSPRWPLACKALIECDIDVGLHLDLSSPFAQQHAPALSGSGLGTFMLRAHLGLLDTRAILRAVDDQLTRFEQALGRAPRFVDGHQHVHQLPRVREALLSCLQSRYGEHAKQIALRSCVAQRWRGLKASVITATGAQGLARDAQRFGHPVNTDFAGVYDFAPQADLPALWRTWLGSLQGGQPLVMCHVATGQDEGAVADPIAQARRREFAWLSSAAWQAMCAELGFIPARWAA